jgi:O-antigen/teichoic acid export membrane protein
LKALVGTITRNLAWLAGGEVFMKGALFVVGVLVARGLGPAAMGAFTVSYGAAVVFMLLLTAGQAEVLMREVARNPADVYALGSMARSWQGTVARFALPAAAVGALFVPVGSLRWALLAFIPYAWFRRSLITIGAAFKGLDRMEVEVAGRALELAVVVALLVPVAALRAPVWATGLAFTAGGAAGLALVATRFRRLPHGEPAGVTRAYLAREGLSFVGLSMSAQILGRMDTFLLAAFGVAQAAIGRYGVAGAPVLGLLGAGQLVAVALYPTLARGVAQGALSRARVLTLGLAGVALGGVLAVGLVLVRGPLVRIVFGSQYLAAVPLIAILAWMLPASCAEMMLGALVAAAGRQSWVLVESGVLIVILGACDLVVIPRWGLTGCAVASVGAQGLGLLAMLAISMVAVRRPRLQPRAVLAGLEVE